MTKRWLNCDCLEMCEACLTERFRCIDCGKNTEGGEYYMVLGVFGHGAARRHAVPRMS
jgi:hypothetical protein